MAEPKCGHSDCMYVMNFANTLKACNYSGVTGHLRKCPADKDCIRYKKKKRGRKKKEID